MTNHALLRLLPAHAGLLHAMLLDSTCCRTSDPSKKLLLPQQLLHLFQCIQSATSTVLRAGEARTSVLLLLLILYGTLHMVLQPCRWSLGGGLLISSHGCIGQPSRRLWLLRQLLWPMGW